MKDYGGIFTLIIFHVLPIRVKEVKKMPKLEPDSVNPKCECGAYLECIKRFNEATEFPDSGVYFTWRCPKCRKEEDQ